MPTSSTQDIHFVAHRAAFVGVWYCVVPVSFYLTRAGSWSVEGIAQWLLFCALAYGLLYGLTAAAAMLAPFFGSDMVMAGGRALRQLCREKGVLFESKPVLLRILWAIVETVARRLQQYVESLNRIRNEWQVVAATPAPGSTVPFLLFRRAPLRIP